MLSNLKNNLYFMTLVTGTLIATSSSSWFSCWLGLEINLMSIIPLLINKINPSSTEASIKYFIPQALASVILITTASSMLWVDSVNFLELQSLLLIVSIGMKIGAAPLHFWLPQVTKTSEWPQIFVLLTWQKLAPMCLIMFSSTQLIFILVYSSCLVGVLGAMNQTSFKKIMVYSSILHSAWMLWLICYSQTIWWFYFCVYSIISASVIFPLTQYPISSIKQLYNNNFPNSMTFATFMNFLSLAGIPPLLGFFMKLTSITSMALQGANLTIIAPLIAASLFALFFYTRFVFSATIIPNLFSNLNPNMAHGSLFFSWFLSLSILGNMAAPLMIYFY